MGNCFGKQSSSEEAFSGPGRTVGSGPPARAEPNARATIPARTAQQSQGRTLGGGDAASSDDDPRTAAARAAEVGASPLPSGKSGGKQASGKRKGRRADWVTSV